MLRYCLVCTARYAPDLAACPHCGAQVTSSLDAPGGAPDPGELEAALAARQPSDAPPLGGAKKSAKN